VKKIAGNAECNILLLGDDGYHLAHGFNDACKHVAKQMKFGQL
jgi:hypothetical protein